MKLGIVLLGVVALLGACADLIASDLPLYCVVDGQRYILPCVTQPRALRHMDQQTLRGTMIGTPIPYGPLAQRPGGRSDVLSPPSRAHWLGTDDRGRDVAARIVHGARVITIIGPLAVMLYVAFGALVGVLCALAPWLDLVLGRFIEAALCVPALLLLLALRGVGGGGSALHVALAIAIAEWPYAARLVRAEALRVVTLPHVLAARGIGASPLRIGRVHVLPLALSPVRVLASFGIAQAVLFEAALGVLGFGVAPPQASWGELLAQAAQHPHATWLVIPPTIAIAIVVLGARLVEARTSRAA